MKRALLNLSRISSHALLDFQGKKTSEKDQQKAGLVYVTNFHRMFSLLLKSIFNVKASQI